MIINIFLLLAAFILIVFWTVKISKGKKTSVYVTPADFQLRAVSVSFATQDGVSLNGWLIKAPQSRKTIILVHGFGMNKGSVLKRTYPLAQQYNLLYFDFRGAGDSSGRSEAGLLENKDVAAAVQFLQDKYPDLAQEIALYGISMGAAAAAYYAAACGGIKCLVMESSYYSFKNIAKRWMWKHAKVPYFPFVASLVFWKEKKLGQTVENFAPQHTASKITCPVLMIQGEKDKLAPVEKAKKIYRLLAGPKQLWVVPQAGHLSCYRQEPKAYIEKITQFFQENL